MSYTPGQIYHQVLTLSAGASQTIAPEVEIVLHNIVVEGSADIYLCNAQGACAKMANLTDDSLFWFVHVGPSAPLKVVAVTDSVIALNGVVTRV